MEISANRDNNATTDQASAPASASSPAVKARSRWKAHPYLLTFVATVLVVWVVGTFALIYYFPRFAYNRLENEIVNHGTGETGSPGIPINTLYTMPNLATPSQTNSLESTGNRDTLYTVGWLDLSKGPEVLHVPDMAGRYYAVQFTDPWGSDFAYVGRRTTGTQAGDYLISGPGWQGTLPKGVKQISSPDNTVLLIGRTLVERDSDLATAYGLSKQIHLTPLNEWESGQ